MADTQRVLDLQVFPRPTWIDNVTCGGMCGAAGGSHCGSLGASACNTEECDEEGKCSAPAADAGIPPVAPEYREVVAMWTADYSSDRAIETSLARLNAALAASGLPLRVTKDTFALFMSQAAPLVALDGQIVFSGMSPTQEQFDRTLASALREHATGRK